MAAGNQENCERAPRLRRSGRATLAFGALAVALGALGLACGGRTADVITTRQPNDGDRSGAGRDASLNSDAGAGWTSNGLHGPDFDPRFDVLTEFGPACEARCQQLATPTACGDGSFPLEVTLPRCITRCIEQVTNTNADCARCVVDGVTWPPDRRWCSDFECGCDPAYGGIIPRLDECTPSCDTSVAYQERLREEVLQPEDIGPQVPEWEDVESPTASNMQPAERGLFMLDSTRRELSFRDFEGANLWRLELETTGEVALVGIGPTSVLVWFNRGAALAIYDDAGQIRDETGKVASLNLRSSVVGSSAGGGFFNINNYGEDGAELSVWSELAELQEVLTIPPLEGSLFTAIPLADGGYLLGTRLSTAPGTTELWRLSAPTEGALDIAWHAALAGEVDDVVELDDGRLFAAGTAAARTEREPLLADEPWAAWVAADGTPVAEWRPESLERSTPYYRALALHEPDGGLYLVTTEVPSTEVNAAYARTPSPQSADPFWGVCSTYGCLRVVVRSFQPNGDIDWEYERASQTSSLRDAALHLGQLWLLAEETREERRTVLGRLDL